MERNETIIQNTGFIKHVFNFDEDTKIDLLNIVQYAFLSIIPLIFLNKSIQRYIPESDDKKGSFEILSEALAQIVAMFVGIFFINRIVTFVPTYSGEKYPEFNLITVILAFLMILLSLQSKLGEKVTILTDRVYDMWGGEQKNVALTSIKKNKVTTTQPIVGGGGGGRHQESRADSLQLIPDSSPGLGGMSLTGAPGGSPDFPSMYVNNNNALAGASNPQGDHQKSDFAPDFAPEAFTGFGGGGTLF